MRKKMSWLLAGLTIALATTNCSTNKQKRIEEKISSLESPKSFNERFDAAFIKTLVLKFNGSNLITKDNATNPNSNPLSDMMMRNEIKDALIAEFLIADDYNKVSEQTYTDCIETRKVNLNVACVNIMDTEVYNRSLAIWMYTDYVKGHAKRAYLRLLEIAETTGDSELVNKISLKTGSGSSQVKSFAKNFKINFENGLKSNIENGYAQVSDKAGHFEFKRKAKNTLDYAAQAELATIVNNENKIKETINTNLENLYKTNRSSYAMEAKTYNSVPRALQDFNHLIQKTNLAQKENKKTQVGWHDVDGEIFKKGDYSLTYDDGPQARSTDKILDYLASVEVKRALGYRPHATYFIKPKNTVYPSDRRIVGKVKKLGYDIGIHPYPREDFIYYIGNKKNNWSPQNINGENKTLSEQINATRSNLEDIYGTQINYFRLPYASGRNSKNLQKQISNKNLVHISWNINADDWRWRSVSFKTIEQNYIREIYKARKGIVILHDVHSNTAGTLTKAIIKYFAKNKLSMRIVPLEKAIQDDVVKIPANGPLIK